MPILRILVPAPPRRMPANPSPAPPRTTDQLIAACLDGDQQAWNEIVRQYRRKVFNIAYKFVGRHDQAEDLTQDVFLKIFKKLGTFDRRANFQTWLISISRNLCIDHYRSARKEREMLDRNVDASTLAPRARGPDPLIRLERGDRRLLLQKALLGLPPALRSAVLLRDIRELSYQEIARHLTLPEGTVKSRINRGRHELARQIRRLEREQEAADGPSEARGPTRASGVQP